MSKKQQDNDNYLDARNIPKFQFQIMNDELVNCIKELYIQSKSQQKIVNGHKKELLQKVSQQQFIDSLQCIEGGLALSPQLNTMLTGNGSIKAKQPYNDPNNLLMTSSAHLGTKLSQVTQILNILSNKLTQLDKKVQRTQENINKQMKQKISSVQQQLTIFVKDYRSNFVEMNKKVDETKFVCETKAKDVEMNTLWKINQCNKRLQQRPTIDMVRGSITETEQRLLKLIQPNGNLKVSGVNNDTAKIEQDIIKLKKLIDFNTIETQSQVKSLSDKLQTSYLTMKAFAEEKLQLIKKIENLSVANGEHARRIKGLQTRCNQTHQMCRKVSQSLYGHNQLLNSLSKKVENLIKSDDIAQMLSQIDPHEICRISTDLKSLQTKMLTAQNRINSLDTFTQALRGKMQFWNSPSTTSNSKQSSQPHIQLITTLIKQQLQSSQFKAKISKHEQQILDLLSLRQGVNDIVKKLSRLNKDNDLTSLKYEIHGVQEYVKKELLILGGRVASLENIVQGFNQMKRRPSSAKIKDDSAKIYASLSTKKLIPASCLSCHQTAPIFMDNKQRQKKIIFSNRLYK